MCPAQCPYLPSAAQPVRDIPEGKIPYISRQGLIVFKMYCCGLRESRYHHETDASDVKALLDTMTRPLALSPQQQVIVNGGIDEVMTHCERKMPLSWWREKLGLPRVDTGDGEYGADGGESDGPDNAEDDGEESRDDGEVGRKAGTMGRKAGTMVRTRKRTLRRTIPYSTPPLPSASPCSGLLCWSRNG